MSYSSKLGQGSSRHATHHLEKKLNCFVHVSQMSDSSLFEYCFTMTSLHFQSFKFQNSFLIPSASCANLLTSWQRARVVGVLTTGQSLSGLTRMSGCQAKSRRSIGPPALFARDSATNRAPEFLDSNCLVPGSITVYLLDSPFPIVMP